MLWLLWLPSFSPRRDGSAMSPGKVWSPVPTAGGAAAWRPQGTPATGYVPCHPALEAAAVSKAFPSLRAGFTCHTKQRQSLPPVKPEVSHEHRHSVSRYTLTWEAAVHLRYCYEGTTVSYKDSYGRGHTWIWEQRSPSWERWVLESVCSGHVGRKWTQDSANGSEWPDWVSRGGRVQIMKDLTGSHQPQWLATKSSCWILRSSKKQKLCVLLFFSYKRRRIIVSFQLMSLWRTSQYTV